MSRGIVKDLTGQRFGRLVVINLVGRSKNRNAIWGCRCDCGEITEARSGDLQYGRKKSCGCLKRDTTTQLKTTHGMRYTRLYHIWRTMKQRCFNPKCNVYKHYGARGIKVCDEWKSDFKVFYDYVSQLPHFGEEGYSLDRIDNDGNYEPNNVKWSTQYEQNHNKRNR